MTRCPFSTGWCPGMVGNRQGLRCSRSHRGETAYKAGFFLLHIAEGMANQHASPGRRALVSRGALMTCPDEPRGHIYAKRCGHDILRRNRWDIPEAFYTAITRKRCDRRIFLVR
ncbi:hypothetical protein MRX96_014592 [Rhipicephalus microplus]